MSKYGLLYKSSFKFQIGAIEKSRNCAFNPWQNQLFGTKMTKTISLPWPVFLE
jgi:hypothetical protein